MNHTGHTAVAGAGRPAGRLPSGAPPARAAGTGAWVVVRAMAWGVGAAIVAALLVAPSLGLTALWNVLIPVAPALLVFAPGVWRNLCPLSTTALAARRWGWSRRRHLSAHGQARLFLAAVALLYLIVPLRHVALDSNGPLTGALLLAVAALALTLGSVFEWKSAWCSSLCPVHPVERLYGAVPALTPPNAHCQACERCLLVCPDSTAQMHPLLVRHPASARWGGVLIAGGLPGFILGWFLVAARLGPLETAALGPAYGLPTLGLAGSLGAFLLAARLLGPARERTLVLAFAAAAVSTYYWFRIPMLFGFGPAHRDGVLVDLRHTLPPAFPWITRTATTALFVSWFLLRTRVRRAWTVRPPFATAATSPRLGG